MELEEMMTPKQVAAWLHVSVRFVRQHAAELGSVQIGGSVRRVGHMRFRVSKIQEWIKGGGSAPARRPNETSSRPQPKRMVS